MRSVCSHINLNSDYYYAVASYLLQFAIELSHTMSVCYCLVLKLLIFVRQLKLVVRTGNNNQLLFGGSRFSAI
jgi:hypothetical protein